MKTYLAISTTNISQNLKRYALVIEALKKNGCKLVANYATESVKGYNLNENRNIDLEMEKSKMFRADLVVIEATTGSFNLGALFGHAINYKKNILVIYDKSQKVHAIDDVVNSYHSSLAQSKEYTLETIQTVISDYLKDLKPETPVKFNFIANRDIVKFLKKGAKKEEKSMSEYLRDLITETFLK